MKTQAERLWAAAEAAEERQVEGPKAFSVGKQRLLLDALLNALPPALADEAVRELWVVE